MSTVYLGNAWCDEYGKASGGDPGDQTGREVRTQPWYLSDKGWRVFRPKTAALANKLVYDMKEACRNDLIGYDQKQRNTLYEVSKSVGFDCAKVSEPCECDCSSLVRVCLAYAGVKTDNFNTASEPSALLKTGMFDEVKEHTDVPDYLSYGTILVTKVKGHTAIVLNDGPTATPYPGPEPPVPPEPTDKYVLVVGGSVNVRVGDNRKTKILFTAHRGDEFPFVAVAPSGWYQIETKKGTGYITSLPRYTRLVEE